MQRIEFNLQSALDGAKLVNGCGETVTNFRPNDTGHMTSYEYIADCEGESDWYTDKGGYRLGVKSVYDLFLSVPYTDIIGNSITEPMLSAEEWYLKISQKEKAWFTKPIEDCFIELAQDYGNYVADYLTKNK